MEQFNETAVRDKTGNAPRLAIFDPDTRVTPVPRNERPAEKPARKRKRPGQSKVKATPDFPLWQRSDGRWCRKIKGRVHYFGTDRDAALEEWERVKADLLAGRTARPKGDGLLLGDLAEHFLNSKRQMLTTGELSPRTFQSYLASCAKLVAAFGKHRRVDDLTASDFERLRAVLADGRGVVTLRGDVLTCRMVFKYGYDNGLIDKPIRYGQSFKIPAKSVLRKARQAAGKRMFSADELRKIIDGAPQTMRTMVLLAANCAFGATDLAMLPMSAIDLERGWVDYPRPKTSVERKIPLWPETVKALREVLAERKEPKHAHDVGLVFLTRCRQRWVRVGNNGAVIDMVAFEFIKLLKRLELRRPRVAFYAIRHTVQTIGEGAKDNPALRCIMGHADSSMSAAYREEIDDARLKAVVEHVRSWLFPAKRKPR